MRRWSYLASLPVLQIALISELARPLAHTLCSDAAPGLAPGGWPALLQLVATSAAIVGSAIALVFPAFALARHRRSGMHRFHGLPGWGVVLALAGAAMLVAGFIVHVSVPAMPIDVRMTAALIARPMVAGGLALATAGVLGAELLRRSVAPVRAKADVERARAGRVEVTYPPELRTRTA